MSLYDIDEKTQIDEYGVCHKDFSLRDELEYNIMRQKEKEQQMKQQSQPQSQVQNVKTQQSQNDNNVEDFMNKLSSLYQEYFGERNYQNRYRKGCTPENILYNTISNYKISPNPKLTPVANYAISKVPVADKLVKNYVRGEQIGNGAANVFNAMEEAGCFK